MRTDLYIFDMDDTLIDGDCFMMWNHFLVEKGIATAPDFLEQDRALMRLYSQGKMSMEEYIEFALQPLEGISIKQLNAWVDECIQSKILTQVYPEARVLIQDLQQQGANMLIISATASFIVQPVAKALGIEQALGIDLEEKQGYLKPKITGVATYREGKVKRLKAWLMQQGLSRETMNLHFYTDSINDLSMCLYVDHTHLVNPCPLLKSKAEEGWHEYQWQRELA